MKAIDQIEGIGPTYAASLKAAGIETVEALLEAGSRKANRKTLSDQTGISGTLILKWVNMADLFRVKGIGSQYAELLECAGVDTVKELAQRNPTNLQSSMESANEEKHVVRQVPALKIVESWVTDAKGLPPKISY